MAQLLSNRTPRVLLGRKSGISKGESSPQRSAAEGKDSACMIGTRTNQQAKKNLDDMNRVRFFEPYMKVIALAGAGAVFFSVAHARLLDFGLPFLLLVLVTVSVGSRIETVTS